MELSRSVIERILNHRCFFPNSKHQIEIKALIILLQDLADDRKALPVHQRRSYVAEEYGTEEIHLKGTDEKSLVPGSSASNKLSRFFDKVIEKQFYRRDKSGSFGSTGHDRRRLV